MEAARTHTHTTITEEQLHSPLKGRVLSFIKTMEMRVAAAASPLNGDEPAVGCLGYPVGIQMAARLPDP